MKTPSADGPATVIVNIGTGRAHVYGGEKSLQQVQLAAGKLDTTAPDSKVLMERAADWHLKAGAKAVEILAATSYLQHVPEWILPEDASETVEQQFGARVVKATREGDGAFLANLAEQENGLESFDDITRQLVIAHYMLYLLRGKLPIQGVLIRAARKLFPGLPISDPKKVQSKTCEDRIKAAKIRLGKK